MSGVLIRLAALGWVAAVMSRAAVVASPSAATIIANSVQANERDWKAAPEFSYTETTRVASGSKTYQVVMLSGSPYNRLLKVNGKPLSPEENQREQQKLDRAAAQRRAESKQATARRVADYEKGRKRDHLMMAQLTQAFNFTVTGEERLAGREVYTLRATPKPSYRPPNLDARVLTGMEGELWIDKQSFQWVKVTARVISPVSIAGFLAVVQPGTHFELEKMPVSDGVWLPSHFEVQSQSTVLFVFRHGTQEEDQYFDYRKTPAQYVASASGR